ncbi:hypothetical protein FHU35_12720 [Saccharopolyspora dendranthemae]|uniref:Uncharacterized protein n=1 Tax=Saccharopolyspora dendranthemae TaxID=1181886 RepID=A0A561U8P2_9PSEU|nr:hypothetical protein FHU35_12720 [Saccharopolyspora dendranthemae]
MIYAVIDFGASGGRKAAGQSGFPLPIKIVETGL